MPFPDLAALAGHDFDDVDGNGLTHRQWMANVGAKVNLPPGVLLECNAPAGPWGSGVFNTQFGWDTAYPLGESGVPLTGPADGLGLSYTLDGATPEVTATEDGIWSIEYEITLPTDATAWVHTSIESADYFSYQGWQFRRLDEPDNPMAGNDAIIMWGHHHKYLDAGQSFLLNAAQAGHAINNRPTSPTFAPAYALLQIIRDR